MPTRTCSKLAAVVGLLLGMSAWGGVAAAEKVAEPSTGIEFDGQKSVDGKRFTLVGVGVRKKLMVKVYAMGMYVEDVEGKRAFPSLATKAGGRDKAKLTEGDRAQSFLLWGQFAKLAQLHFVRDVGADKVRGAFEEGLGEELSSKAPADVRQAAQAFLKLIDRDMKNGEELTLRTGADGKIELSTAGEAKGTVQNAKLVRALWSVWLGAKPSSKELRGELVNRIDRLSE